MALNSTRVAAAIVNALDNAGKYDDALDSAAAKAESQILIQIIMDELIKEIQINAEVSTTVDSGIAVTVDPNTGVGSTDETGEGTGGIS